MNTPHSIRCNPKPTFRFAFCSLICAIFHLSLCLVSILFDLVASLLKQLLSVQRLRTTGYIVLILLLHPSHYSQRPQQTILQVNTAELRAVHCFQRHSVSILTETPGTQYNCCDGRTWVGLLACWFVLSVFAHGLFNSSAFVLLASIFYCAWQ